MKVLYLWGSWPGIESCVHLFVHLGAYEHEVVTKCVELAAVSLSSTLTFCITVISCDLPAIHLPVHTTT